MNRLFIAIFLVTVASCLAENKTNLTERKGRDSYIDAYYDSHGSSANLAQKNIDRDSKYSPNVGDQYGPPTGYPEIHYPAPGQHYGPPVYGPPHHIPRYNTYPGHFPLHEMPHAMLGLLDKFHLKLDILTILKIILKLVIFKKIVGFIALICLLLFIPKFKMDKEDADDPDARVMRTFKYSEDDRLNNLTSYVVSAIENFSDRAHDSSCTGFTCVARNASQYLDEKYSYSRLLTMYTEEV